jgi:hypothetical protein
MPLTWDDSTTSQFGDIMTRQPSTDDLVVVATVSSLPEADVIRNSLEEAGIEAFIENENAMNLFGSLGQAWATRGIRVRVLAADVEAAREAMAAGRQASVDLDPHWEPQDEDEPPYRRDPANMEALSAFYLSLVFILVLPFALRTYRNAKRLARQSPPVDEGRYSLHMTLAAIFMTIHCVMFVWIIASVIAHR